MNTPPKMAASFRGLALLTGGLASALLLTGLSAPAHGANIRLMPIGDSITSGFQSSTNNGYRASLYNQLIAQGNQTDFVGSIRDGDTFDPDHEGHSGYRIEQVAGLLNGVLSNYQPNLVTLHIGSNDMNQNYQVSSAPNRLASMIDQILAGSPGVTIVVAQLIPNSNSEVQTRINAYNNAIPGIVQSRTNAGKHVYMVSMNSLNTGDLKDGLHPNDGGYQKMANVWYAGIQQVISRGWVTNLPFAGTYEIQCVSSGQALDVSGGSPGNNAAIVQFPYGGARNQKWNFIPTSNGYFQIQSANSGLDLNVAGVSTAYGALVVQYQYGTQQNDQWLPSRNSDGTYTFYNRHSGLVLDMPGYSTGTTQFDQWGATGGTNQRFNCIPR